MATSSCKISGEFRILISKAKKKKNFFLQNHDYYFHC